MSDRDGILDIHGKCRREREELEARVAALELNDSVEVEELKIELAKAEEELGHYKRVVNGTIPDHAMGRHEQTRATNCPFCQSTTAAEDNAQLRAELTTATQEWRRYAEYGDGLEAKLAEAERLLDADEMGQIQAGWDAAKAELNLLRPVVEAAKAWAKVWAEAPARYLDGAEQALRSAVDALAAAEESDPRRAVSGQTSGEDETDGGAICSCAVAEQDGHLASKHTDCGGGPAPCGGCHSCLLRQMHHARRTALREQWSVPCPACHMPAGKACTDAAGLLPEHMNHPARGAAYAAADSRAGQAGEEVDRG